MVFVVLVTSAVPRVGLESTVPSTERSIRQEAPKAGYRILQHVFRNLQHVVIKWPNYMPLQQ